MTTSVHRRVLPLALGLLLSASPPAAAQPEEGEPAPPPEATGLESGEQPADGTQTATEGMAAPANTEEGDSEAAADEEEPTEEGGQTGPEGPDGPPPGTSAEASPPDSSTETTLEETEEREELGSMPEEDFLPPDAAVGLSEPIPRPQEAEPDMLAELERFERALRAYEGEVVEYREDISRLVRLEYGRRRRAVQDVYDNEIEVLRHEEREYRLDAIARLEAFVERYPHHPPETPDALFRLAELYFEQESDDFVQRDEEYARLLEAHDLGEVTELPSEPRKDYSRTIATFRRVVEEFPDYRQVDGAHYLMGYAMLQMGEEQQAVRAFRALVRDFPESAFAQEAWVRVGEYLFELNQYPEAAAAYSRAIEYGAEGRLYDEALFKLGWAHYLTNSYQQSLDTFVDLILFYEEAENVARPLREEALQYMAVVLSEEDWDIDGSRDPDAGMPRVRNQLNRGAEWELDVIDRLTDVWFESERYDLAIQGYRYSLDRWPTDRRNPERHERIVAALARQRDFDEAFAEQLRMVDLYGTGSEWYEAQEQGGNIRAMVYAEELARTTVLDAARYYNEQADLYRDRSVNEPELEDEAIARYQYAADGYAAFLSEYPNDREAYEVRFLYAQALYYSFDFIAAAEQYELVRDINGPRQELAGYQVVKSLEVALLEEIDRGRLPTRALPTYQGDDEEEPPPDRDELRESAGPLPISELTLQLVDAYDNYVALGLNSAEDPTTQGRFAFLAAEVFFDHRDFEEARARYQAILNNPTYRAQDEGVFAAAQLIESYRIEGDFEGMEEWSQRIQQIDFGGEGIDTTLLAEFIEEAETMRVGAAYLQAEELFQGEDYEAAALEFVRVVNQNPEGEYAAAALNNAAVAYERIQRFEPAMRLYQRVVDDYPDCDFVNTALFRVAVNSRRFFDFDRAINTYLVLAQREGDEIRARDAMFAAAELQMHSERFAGAAGTYESFHARFNADENAPIALYRAGLMYEEEGRYPDMERVWGDMRREYGSQRSTADIPIDAMIVDSLRRTGDYYAEVRGDPLTAATFYEQVLEEYEVRGPTDVDSAFSAGKSKFWLAEQVFNEWHSVRIDGDIDRQRQIVQQQIQDIPVVVDQYNAVTELGSAEWTMAAYYMVGRIYQAFADKLYEVPVPESIRHDEDLVFAYQLELEDFAGRFQEEAVANWQVAMELARQTGVVNEWTISIIRQLNRYLGSEFPLYKEEPDFLQTQVISPPPLTGAPERVSEDFPELEDFEPIEEELDDLEPIEERRPEPLEELDEPEIEDIDEIDWVEPDELQEI